MPASERKRRTWGLGGVFEALRISKPSSKRNILKIESEKNSASKFAGFYLKLQNMLTGGDLTLSSVPCEAHSKQANRSC